MMPLRSPLVPATLLLALATAMAVPMQAAEDSAPVNMTQILQALKGLKDQQVQQSKAQKLRAIQEVSAAAKDPARAAEIWEEAVRTTQFAGASKEATQFREWKDNEGSALRSKEVAMALRLHFNWLAVTLQRSAGTPLRELLPSIVQHTKEATAAKLAMEQFEENMKREKDSGAAGKNARERQNNDAAIKKLYDQVVSKPVSSGIVAQSLRIEPLVNEAAQGNGKGQAWEMSASNVDGIFTSIILPELRAQKDPRVLEYWDMKLRTGAEDATRNKLAFEADKFNNITRPQLLWQRAQDMVTIGQQNRAVGEMFTIVKTYPSHPNATAWMSSLEQLLSQALAPAPAPAAAAAAPVPGAAPQTP